MSTADKTRRSYSYKATDKPPAQKKTKGEGWGGKRPGAGRPRKNPVGTKPHSLYFRVRVRKDLHRKWREMKDAGGFATDTDFVKHLLGVVDEEPTPVAQPPSAKPPASHKARPFSQCHSHHSHTHCPANTHAPGSTQGESEGGGGGGRKKKKRKKKRRLPPSSPSPPPQRRGRKRKAGPLGGQKAAKQSKKKAEPAGGTSGSPGGWGLKPSTSSDVRPPTPCKAQSKATQEATEAHQPKVGVVGKGLGTSKGSGDGHHKAASDHAELDQDLADIRNGTLHHAAAEKPCVADVVSTDQAAKNSSSEENK
eukprot:Em0208g4a